MKITIAALSRFHLFQMSRQLLRCGLKTELITGYPRYILKNKWNDLWLISFTSPYYALIRFIVIKANKLGYTLIADKLQHYMHKSFSKKTSNLSQARKTDILIGMSSFMKETIQNNKNSIVIVDHGSLHIKTERDLLKKECEKFGFKESGNWKHSWMIDRMDYEFKHADFVFCCSDLAKETIVSNGVEAGKVFANPLGVDLNLFPYKRNLNHNKFVFLHVSNMGPIKGLQYFIPAFKALENTNIELWLVGPMPNEPLLVELIQSDDRIKYIGYKPESELSDIYAKCDVFVHPSVADGWAMTVLQSMAVGTPVIVSDMTGAKEIIKHGENGWIVPYANKNVLSDLMLELTSQKNSVINIGKEAHFSVQENFTWNSYGDRLDTWIKMNIKG